MYDDKTRLFREQHQELLKIMNKLENSFKNENMVEQQAILMDFAEKLKIHLFMEDNALYPILLASKEDSIREMAKEFMVEMGSLSKNFEEYKKKWIKSTHIKFLESFKKETHLIIQALRTRIKKENKELFPLVDRF